MVRKLLYFGLSCIIAIVLAVLLVVPTVGCDCSDHRSPKMKAFSRMKFLGTSMQLYTGDYDSIYPPLADTEDVLVLLRPYGRESLDPTPNSEYFEVMFTRFNAALAGVSTTLPPIAGAPQTDPSEIPMWYSLVREGKSSVLLRKRKIWRESLLVCFADSSVKELPIDDERFWRGLSAQFSR